MWWLGGKGFFFIFLCSMLGVLVEFMEFGIYCKFVLFVRYFDICFWLEDDELGEDWLLVLDEY